MRNVFDPNALELADLGGDTHFITDIQRQIEQLLKPNSTDHQQIKSELEKLGPRAVPGILNAAYVFSHRLEANRERTLLADLLANLIGANEAARGLLLTSGILEAPFVMTRATALLALHKLGNIQKGEIDSIRTCAWSAYIDEDYQGALNLYHFLVIQRDTHCCSEIQAIAKKTFEEYFDIAPCYLELSLRCAPRNTYDILMETIGRMEPTAIEFGKDIREMSALSITNLPEVLRAAHTIYDLTTRKTNRYAHKGIENLFTGALWKFFNEYPERIIESGAAIQQEYTLLTRFFWQCLGRLLKFEVVKEYFATKTSEYKDEFVLEAAVQLLYIREGKSKFKYWAAELLERIEVDSPWLYSDAVSQHERRSGRTVIDDTEVIEDGPSRLE